MNGLTATSAVLISFLLFKLIFPPKKLPVTDLQKIKDNKDRYERLERQSPIWLLLSLGLTGFLVFILGVNIRDAFFPSDFDYVIQPPNVFWLFPGLLLGLGLIRIPMDFIYKRFLKDEYSLYHHYTNMKHGFDGLRVWRALEVILTLAGIGVFILGLNWYVRIKDNSLEINELFGMTTVTYQLDDITDITHHNTFITKSGDEKSIDHYVIEMDEGYRWSSHVFGFFASEKDKEKLGEKIQDIGKMTGAKLIAQ
jgi:hypothetical protein